MRGAMSGEGYRVERFLVRSRALEGNPLGDPVEREVLLLVPPGARPGEALPHVWMLAGFGGTGRSFLNFEPWAESLPERVDRLYREGRIGPMLFALPDTFTALGGNQHVDSEGVGRYARFLWEEARPAVEARYPARGRAVAGKSSGGYGALVNAMRHPGLFDACVAHSADMAFELCYWPDLGDLLREAERAGGLRAFREQLLGRRWLHLTGSLRSAVNLYAMALTYAPDPAAPGGTRLPVDPETGSLDEEVWQRWLEHDPVRMALRPEAQEALRRLQLLFFDCGTQDEFNLLYGARRLHRLLEAAGVAHRFETFEDGHQGVGYRWDRSLPLVWETLGF
ncbi:MAG: alpha/beta hydrolase-fold protein [Bacillota bacterium]|nr:alpha/beta hydrolase-fold protein [Bacillota bacterium]